MVAQHQPMNAQQHQPMGGAAQLEQPMRVQYQVDPEQHTVYATRREPDLRLQPSKDSGIAIYFIVIIYVFVCFSVGRHNDVSISCNYINL